MLKYIDSLEKCVIEVIVMLFFLFFVGRCY